MRYRLTALVRDPDPSSRSMSVPMFAIDSSPILALQASWVAKFTRKRMARGDMHAGGNLIRRCA